MNKFKIGIFGSAEGNTEEILVEARELGKALGKHDVIVLTGASNGLPYEVAQEAFKNGAEIWDYPPSLILDEAKKDTPSADFSIFKKIIFVPEAYEFNADINVRRKYRNITTTTSCDAGIIISGRWGTMNEFT